MRAKFRMPGSNEVPLGILPGRWSLLPMGGDEHSLHVEMQAPAALPEDPRMPPALFRTEEEEHALRIIHRCRFDRSLAVHHSCRSASRAFPLQGRIQNESAGSRRALSPFFTLPESCFCSWIVLKQDSCFSPVQRS